MNEMVRLAAVGDVHCTRTSEGALQPLFAQMVECADVIALTRELVAPLSIEFVSNEPFDDRRGPGIDGHAAGQAPISYTLLAKVFVPDAAGLVVWPGSHLAHQELFHERGTRALVEVGGDATRLSPPSCWRPPSSASSTRPPSPTRG